MSDWTDRRRPVWARYEEWKRLHGGQIRPPHEQAAAQLLQDLAAVLRSASLWAPASFAGTPEGLLQEWQDCARDPETGERIFP